MSRRPRKRAKREGGPWLPAAEALALEKAQAEATERLLEAEPRCAHVVGTAVGVKWTAGRPTGIPAVLVLVTHKVAVEKLSPQDVVPQTIAQAPTDVLEVGHLIAGGPLSSSSGQTLTARVRPVRGGYSVGHPGITAGTVATAVYDLLPAEDGPPSAAAAPLPSRYYLLSNNHVLANANQARAGDPILQPGPFDGGRDPEDRVARLSRWVPIAFEPPTPRSEHENLVDAAVAEGGLEDLDRSLYWIGPVRGWRPKAEVPVGLEVQKTGRTTGYTRARIMALNATVDVNYSGGRVARFREQLLAGAMSAGGDSGSLVTSLDGVALGLLFAGSPLATVLNAIENVRALLQVEMAELRS